MDPVKNFLLSSLIIRQNLAAVSLTVCAYVGVPKKILETLGPQFGRLFR